MLYKSETPFVHSGYIQHLIQGTQEENLFEQPDNTPRSLAQAIKETLNIDYNGQHGGNVLAGYRATSQRGQQGSSGDAATGERTESGTGAADGGGGVESDSGQGEVAADYKSVKCEENKVDSQGNPIDESGNLIVEKIDSLEDITDKDFIEPTRMIELPVLPTQVQRVLATNGKGVIIKKNILERNAQHHTDLTLVKSREILKAALYNPTLYGKNKPLSRPNNWIVINVPNGDGNNKLVVLEVSDRKDYVEIVHWHEVDARGLEKIKK